MQRPGQSGGIQPGSGGSYPSYLTNVGGTLFFRALDGSNGFELWRLSGSGTAEMVNREGADGINPNSQ